MNMNWNCKKNKLIELIKKVSSNNGGDDPDWLSSYAQDMINAYRDKLDIPIACFEDIQFGKKPK